MIHHDDLDDNSWRIKQNMRSSLLSTDVFYTGTADGKILKLVGRRIHTVARLGEPPCGETVVYMNVVCMF